MKKLVPRSLIAALALLGLIVVSHGWTADEGVPDVAAILKKTKEVFEPSKPSLRKVVITLKGEGKDVQWIAAQAMKKFPDGKRMVLVMLEPNDVKGTAYLGREQENGSDKTSVYLPFVRRVLQIEGVEQYDRFLATDFTYFDFGFIRVHENYRLIGEEDYRGMRAYKLEENVPSSRSYYKKILIWISKGSLLPLQREYYDLANRLWKVETFDDVATIEGVPTPMRITMKDVQSNTSTELKLSEVQYCGDLDNILFDPEHLGEVAAHPIWQPYCTFPTEAKK